MRGTDILTLLGALAAIPGPGALAAEPAATAPKSPIVACTLTPAEKRERSALVERELVPAIREVIEAEHGYVLWFDRAAGRLATVASFVELESRCCAFLDFAIRVDAGGERIALEITGPEGTKEMLRPLLEKRGE
jgi:hypothetical protein